MFGSGGISLQPTLPTIYVIGKSNHKTEFSLKPVPPK